MDRKQGVIHLGRSKSPSRYTKTDNSNKGSRIYTDLVNTSRERPNSKQRSRQPLQESVLLNNSMHVTPHLNKVIKQQYYSSTCPGFYPPSPRMAQQRIIIKQNTRPEGQKQTPQKIPVLAVSNSPLKRMVVSRPIPVMVSPQLQIQQESQIQQAQRQNQLQRKIKVLQSRVQQLHQEKQAISIRSYEDNKKLCQDNSYLKGKIQQLTKTRDEQIFRLRNQLSRTVFHGQTHRIQQVQKTSKPMILLKNQLVKQCPDVPAPALKNAAYTDSQQQKTSISKISDRIQHANRQFQYQNKELSCKISQMQQQLKQKNKQLDGLHQGIRVLEEQNKVLKSQLHEVKQQIVKNAQIIGENNKKIVLNYEQKISQLLEQMARTKSSPDYQQKYQELNNKLVDQCKKSQQYVDMLLKKSQQQMQMEQKYKEQIAQLERKAIYLESCQQEGQAQIKLLQGQLKEIMQQRNWNGSLKKQTQVQTQLVSSQQDKQPVEQCQKCKQLIKTLVKLNQKAFTKTM